MKLPGNRAGNRILSWPRSEIPAATAMKSGGSPFVEWPRRAFPLGPAGEMELPAAIAAIREERKAGASSGDECVLSGVEPRFLHANAQPRAHRRLLPPDWRFRQARLCAWSGRPLGSATMSKLPLRTILDLDFGASDSIAPFAWRPEAEPVPLLRPWGAHRSTRSAPVSAGGRGFEAGGAVLAWAG